MTSPPGLLSMNRISTRCQINYSLYINADCNRFVERCNNESKSIHLGKVVRGKGGPGGFVGQLRPLGGDHKGFVIGSSVNLDFKIARIRLG